MSAPLFVLGLIGLILITPVHAAERFVETGSIASPHAHQAAAADEKYFYAIASECIAKIDRQSGTEIETSTGRAKHLNSGFFWDGKLYCAHSNYPRKPERSEIMVLDPGAMTLSAFKDFGEYKGSLTWVVRDKTYWWCNFARYGTENAGTVLVKFDADWNEVGAWTYPEEVIAQLGRNSISGGLWWDGDLLVTDHDHRVIYRLRLPESGAVLQLVSTLPSPFPGQGIAIDPVKGGLIGIDRARKLVILAELRKEPAAAPHE